MSHSNASRTRPNNDRTKFVRPRGRAVCGLAREATIDINLTKKGKRNPSTAMADTPHRQQLE